MKPVISDDGGVPVVRQTRALRGGNLKPGRAPGMLVETFAEG